MGWIGQGGRGRRGLSVVARAPVPHRGVSRAFFLMFLPLPDSHVATFSVVPGLKCHPTLPRPLLDACYFCCYISIAIYKGKRLPYVPVRCQLVTSYVIGASHGSGWPEPPSPVFDVHNPAAFHSRRAGKVSVTYLHCALIQAHV